MFMKFLVVLFLSGIIIYLSLAVGNFDNAFGNFSL